MIYMNQIKKFFAIAVTLKLIKLIIWFHLLDKNIKFLIKV